ncbi:MAG: SDR family NAD(P)-dependent oxidoreductase [Planctomycetota bacterium]
MRWSPRGAVAIVTGASSGIGRELTRLLSRRGASVVAVARRSERLEELREESNDRIIPIVGDVTDASTRHQAFAAADAVAGGTLDLLVNNAGVGAIGRFEDADDQRLRAIMEVNFFAPVAWSRDAIARMKRAVAVRRAGPIICNIGSVLGHRGVPDKSEYCASKFAIHGFSDSLRAELAGDGIAVTLVSPSTTESEFFESLVDSDDDVTSKSLGQWPAARVARSAFAAIASRRAEVILSLGGKALVYADRVSPPLVNAVMARTASPAPLSKPSPGS